MRILAVDPGVNGALVFIEFNKPVFIYDMPTMKVGSKTKVDVVGLAQIIGKHGADAIVVEQVGASPMMGTSSAFGFGYSFGSVLGVSAGCGIECHTITPQRWKTYHGLIKKPKDASRVRVVEMFPDISEQFKLKKHVDRADALLLGLAWLRITKND